MIRGSIHQTGGEARLPELVRRALEVLRTRDLTSLPPGRYDLEGSDLYFEIQQCVTQKQVRLEKHDLYADLHVVLRGEEAIAACAEGAEPFCLQAEPEKDIWFYQGEAIPILLGEGDYLLVLPGELHGPRMAAGEPVTVKKAVFKIRIR